MTEVAAFVAGVLFVGLWLAVGWARELAEYERASKAAQERVRREFR